jgi:ornithine carbamoyltransferase
MYAVAPAPSVRFRGRHFLEVTDMSPDELATLLQLARVLKATKGSDQRNVARGKTLALLFEKPSLRTRVSFEVAMQQLGGETLFAAGGEFMVGSRETPEDAARVLSRYVDAIVVRTHAHEPLERFAHAATVPVINGLSAQSHPCQALADALTIEEKFGSLDGLTVAYLGDGRNNVALSLAQACMMLGASVHFGSPTTHRPYEATLAGLKKLGEATGADARAFTDPVRAVRGADVVYTDVWTSMGDEQFREQNEAMLRPYAVTEELLCYAQPHAIFMHCLPAHRGEEVSHAVIESAASAVFDQAENRLHAQKALLVALLTDAKGFV